MISLISSSFSIGLREEDYGNYEPLMRLIVDRISWTLTRVFIRSELYKFFKSEEFRCFFGTLTDSGMYQTFMQQLKIIQESED